MNNYKNTKHARVMLNKVEKNQNTSHIMLVLHNITYSLMSAQQFQQLIVLIRNNPAGIYKILQFTPTTQ